MSYNFETNFYLPYYDPVQGIVPVPFATIDEPDVNSGTIVWYQNHPNDERTLNDDNVDQVNSNITDVDLAETETSNKTVITKVGRSFKKTNSTQSSVTNGRKKIKKKKKKKKTKKSRVNREILTTLLSRKKFYKILKHKLDMLVENQTKKKLKY